MKDCTILLVEDEFLIGMGEKHRLEKYGYKVTHVQTGAAAVELIQQDPSFFDIVLMDMDLGEGIDGAKTAKRLLSITTIPVIFLSGHVEPEVVAKTEEITSYGYVTKDTAVTVIDASIKMALRLFEAKQELLREKEKYETYHTKSQKQQQKIEKLLEASKYILETEEFEKVARHVFDAACFLTGASSGYVAMLSDDGSENELLFLESGGAECTVDPYLPMPIRGLRGVAYADGKAVYDNNFAESKWMRYMPEGHMHLANVLFAPLNIDEKTVGIIGIANKPSDFTDEDARITESFANLAALSLKNSRFLNSIIEQKKEVEQLLKDKEVLLVEVHHRIKNNMQMVYNLLSLSNTKEDAMLQVKSMMVLYDRLYRSKDFKAVSMKDFLEKLVMEIQATISNNYTVSITTDFSDIALDSKKMLSISIVLNELITNSLKYAFTSTDKPEISLSSSHSDDLLQIVISDNSPGFDYDAVKNDRTNFGMQLIQMMSDKLKAEINYTQKPVSTFTITIPHTLN